MGLIDSLMNRFIDHPFISAMRYTFGAAVGGFICALISIVTGNFDVTVPINGIFMLLSIILFAVIRFGLYFAADRILRLNLISSRLLALFEVGYLATMFWVAWDIMHPQMSQGAYAMMAMLFHVLTVPLAFVVLAAIGITYGIKALIHKFKTRHVVLDYRPLKGF